MNPALPSPLTGRTLETSETEFAEYYASFAAKGELYPQTEGSPLLEFAAAGQVLYLFDRCGPYAAAPGPARVVVHGILDLDETQVLDAHAQASATESLSALSGAGAEGVGQVIQTSRRTWVVQARIPLVLSSFEALSGAQPGDWVRFKVVPPLHGFVVSDKS